MTNTTADKILAMWQTRSSIADIATALGIPLEEVESVLVDARTKGDHRMKDFAFSHEKRLKEDGRLQDGRRLAALRFQEVLENVAAAEAIGDRVTLEERAPDGCCWVVGENAEGHALYCGRPKRPADWCRFTLHYCEEHTAIAANPQPFNEERILAFVAKREAKEQ